MKPRLSLAALMICLLVLAYVIVFCKTANVADSPTSLRRPTGSEFAIRLLWACPLALFVTLSIIWIARKRRAAAIARLKESNRREEIEWLEWVLTQFDGDVKEKPRS